MQFEHNPDDKCVLVVRRAKLLRTTLQGIREPEFDFNKYLFVEFSGEEGVDEGGVKREFFRYELTCYENNDFLLLFSERAKSTISCVYWFILLLPLLPPKNGDFGII